MAEEPISGHAPGLEPAVPASPPAEGEAPILARDGHTWMDVEDLRASERRFRALVENGSTVICLVDETATVRYFSPSVERLLAYTTGGLLGSSILGCVNPDDAPRVGDLLAEVTARPYASASAEFRMRHANGSWVWVEAFAENRLDDLSLRAVVLTIHDISMRKVVEDEARGVEQRYRSYLEQVPAIVYVDRIEGDPAAWPTIFIGPQVEDILGYTPEEWLADPGLWDRIVHPDDRALAVEGDVAQIEGQGGPNTYRVFARDGRVVWLRDEATIVRDRDGNPLFQEGILTDITELKTRELEVAEAQGKYRSLVLNLPIGFFTRPIDPPASVTFASHQLAAITGYSREEWTSDPGLSLRIVHRPPR